MNSTKKQQAPKIDWISFALQAKPLLRRRAEPTHRIKIPKSGSFSAFAILVDINGFTRMVKKAEMTNSMATFTHDVLAGAIMAVEGVGGEVVGFMGDALLGLIENEKSTAEACIAIADDVDRQCEYMTNAQSKTVETWPFAPGGPSLKIAVEYGEMDICTIQSRFLGEQRLIIGSAINSTSRIIRACEGNQCVIGASAAKHFLKSFSLDGPHRIAGKKGEEPYRYYFFQLEDFWVEGPRRPGEESSLRL
jgi:class 3 adenylate cyclase